MNNIISLTDAICAISTSPGMGAIAIVRLSGINCIEIVNKVFCSSSLKSLSSAKPNVQYFGKIITGDVVLDEVLVTVFLAPHSYTGEDSVEISCHGSVYIQQNILQLLVDNGARLALPGEFTKRAFLNGKMDLSQAEAVSDLIESSSAAMHRMAMTQMRGGFTKELSQLRKELLELSSLVELELDFSEEDVEFADRNKLDALVKRIEGVLSALCESFKLGNVIKNGVPVAIVGNTNVGKSTLLNLFLKEEKAIVSSIAGTTRDVIEDSITLNGIQFRFIDTAGIRNTVDEVENIGIERTFERVSKARVVLFLIDASQPVTSEITGYLKAVSSHMSPDTSLITVFNKCDIANADVLETNKTLISGLSSQTISISAKKSDGLERLTTLLTSIVGDDAISSTNVIVSNVRHYEALSKALQAIRRVSSGLSAMISGDFVAQDLRECIAYLSEITGEITTDDILGTIFTRFCIGK